ncbi:MAG: hypothetical protein U0610_09165 [bacterium]
MQRRERGGAWLLVLVSVFALSRAIAGLGWIDAERLGAAGGPTTLALDDFTGRVFVGSWNAQTVVATDRPGAIQGVTLVRGHRPAALAWSPRERMLFFVCYSRDHVCAVHDAPDPTPPDCFCPESGDSASRRWQRCEARHSPFTVPEGGFEGQVETLVREPTSGALVTIAGHIGSGVGFHKDFAWLTALAWNGHELETRAPGVDLAGPYHDHNALPLTMRGASGPLLLVRPSAASLVEIAWPGLTTLREVKVGSLPLAIVALADGERYWIADGARPQILEIAASTLAVRRRLSVPEPVSVLALDASRAEVWAVSRAGDRADALAVDSGEIVRHVDVRKPSAAVVDESRRALWIASLGDGQLHRVELEGAGAPLARAERGSPAP